jgi:SAM-dependent methyltransferase
MMKQKIKNIAKSVLPFYLKKKIKNVFAGNQSQIEKLKTTIADQDIKIRQLEWFRDQFNLGLYLPPKHLQVRVSGSYYWPFFVHGMNMLLDINKVLEKNNLSLYNFSRILDFGCGCGRFLIPFSLMTEPEKLFGCDIDQEAIEWFSRHYKNLGGLYASPHHPPLNYEDNFFDFIYSISIFTHLPEEMQFAWLKELKRITKKNGWLVISTHGEKFIGEMPAKYHEAFRKKGFYYLDEAEVTDGLPVFYKGAYHLHDYIEKEWSAYFRVVAMIDKGVGEHQDLILLQKITD